MYVVKRDGTKEPVRFDKITARISRLSWKLDLVEPVLIAQKVIHGLFTGVTTSELDEFAAETAAYSSSDQPQYGKLAGRIAVSNLHKSTKKSFSAIAQNLRNCTHPKNGDPTPLLSESVYNFIQTNANELDSAIIHDRDFNFDYFGFKTLCKSYLLKINDKVVERPQHMFMRVACALHVDDLESVIETYNMMALGYFIHATPTLFNAGLPHGTLSSCFLLMMQDDSVEGIYTTLKQCAQISKGAGGVGLAVTNIRAQGSYIGGTNGTSNGIVPMLRVYNMSSRYIDQGGQRRPGSFAIYLEPWHADIFSFLELKKDNGAEEVRARDLFFGLWVPDLFMERVENDGDWSLFCPHEAPGLEKVWGKAFRELYEKYEQTRSVITGQPLARETIKARKLWTAILDVQEEKSVPYMLFKDSCNAKSNQQHCGTIRTSNLCTEIIEYVAPDEVAVCNLASIALNRFVQNGHFNFKLLQKVVKIVCRNLNRVIDITKYPVKEAAYSNHRHRPIGIGVQGLADLFIILRLPFDSREAAMLNKDIFEAMYFAACEASCELAEKFGPYETFPGSPMSLGKFQFDLWGATPSGKFGDWNVLRERVMIHGMRNSLLMAPMPTASTSQILGNNECFEPFTSNIYVRRTGAGAFICVSKYLVRDLENLGLWNANVKNQLIANDGSVQNISVIPDDLKALYKTVWEIKSKVILDMAADRGIYICQSQSMNVHMADVNHGKLTSLHFYAWKAGLKTGMYYLRSRPAADAIKFTVDQEALQSTTKPEEPCELKSNNNHDSPYQTHLKRKRGVKNKEVNEDDIDFIHNDQNKKQHTFDQEEDTPLVASTIFEQKRKQKELDMICSLNNRDACEACGS